MLEHPNSKQELINAIHDIFPDSARVYVSFEPDAFFEPDGEKWSPAQNVYHLLKSTAPVVLLLSLPKFPLIFFGRNKGESMTYDEVVAAYQAKLKEGAKSPKAYYAKPFVPDDATASQEKLVRKWRKLGTVLAKRLENWREADLDRYKAPHPILGKLTIREMLLFTLYHIEHHTQTVEKLAMREAVG